MFRHFRPPLLITAAAVLLLFVAMATLRDAPADITAAVFPPSSCSSVPAPTSTPHSSVATERSSVWSKLPSYLC